MKEVTWKSYLAEALGTFALVFFGVGAAFTVLIGPNTVSFQGVLITVGLSLGLAYAAMTYVTNHLSGGHLNPAVTFAAWVAKRIETMHGICYIIAQLLGGVVAAYVLQAIFNQHGSALPAESLLPALGDGVTKAVGFWTEFILALFLAWTALSMWDKRAEGGHRALAMGFLVFVGTIAGWTLTRGLMNPMFPFSLDFVVNNWTNYWIYSVAPLAGALIAGLAHTYVFEKED